AAVGVTGRAFIPIDSAALTAEDLDLMMAKARPTVDPQGGSYTCSIRRSGDMPPIVGVACTSLVERGFPSECRHVRLRYLLSFSGSGVMVWRRPSHSVRRMPILSGVRLGGSLGSCIRFPGHRPRTDPRDPTTRGDPAHHRPRPRVHPAHVPTVRHPPARRRA